MPGTGDGSLAQLWQFALQGLAAGGLIGLASVVWGFWDRWRVARRESRTDDRQEGQDILSQQRQFVQDLQADRSDLRLRVDELEAELEAVNLERGRVWRAARRMEDFAHTQRRLANERISEAASVARLMQQGVADGLDGQALKLPAPLPSPPTLESFLPADAAAE